MANLFTLIGTILIDNTKADSSIAKTAEKASSFAGKLVSGAATAAKWGAAVATAAAGAAVALGTTALKSAADFEQQMSNVGTLLSGDSDSVSARMKELGNEVKAMSSDTAVSTDLLTDGLYQVISALGDSSDSMSILETAAKGAKAGNATVTDSVNLLSAVMKGYNDVSADAASKTSDLAFKTVKLGQTSFPELASSMGKVIPLASTLNVSQEELFTTYATLTGVTGTAAEVTTQMKAALTGLMSPTKQMQEKMKGLGYESGDAMIKALGLEGSFLALKESCGGSDIALAKLFSSTEAQTAVMALAGSQADTYKQKLNEMSDAAGATQTAFETQTDNFNSRMDSIKNKMDVLFITVGEKMLPIANDVAAWVDDHFPEMESVVTGAVDMISDGVGIMQDMFDEATDLIKSEVKPRIDDFGTALGKLYDATEPVRNAFSDLISPLTESAGQVDIVSVAVDALDFALDTATDAVELMSDGITAVCDAVEDANNWCQEHTTILSLMAVGIGTVVTALIAYNAASIVKSVSSAAETAAIYALIVAENAHTIASGIATAATTAFGAAVAFLTSPITLIIVAIGALVAAGVLLYKNWDTVTEKCSEVWGKVTEIWENIKTSISEKIESIKTTISEKLDAIKNTIKVCWEAIKAYIKPAMDAIKMSFNVAWNAIKNTISTVSNAIKTTITSVWNAIKTAVSTVMNSIKNTVSTVWNAIKSAISSVTHSVKSTVSSVFSAIKTVVSNVMNSIKSTISSVWIGIKSTVSGAVNGIKNAISGGFNAAKSTVSSVFNSIKSTVSEKINGAKDTVKSAIEKIKGFFNFSWSLPKLKMPHPKISGEFSLNPPKVPSFSIDWYAKAMDNGMILNHPTIFGMDENGTPMGGGEAGSETVVGTGSLMEMIRAAVSAEMSELMQYFERLIALLTKFFPEILEAMDRDIVLDDGTLVGRMDQKMGRIISHKERGN